MESVKQGVDQRLGEGQEKLHQMWLTWNQKTPQDAEKDPSKPEVPAGALGSPCESPCPAQCKPCFLSPEQPQNPCFTGFYLVLAMVFNFCIFIIITGMGWSGVGLVLRSQLCGTISGLLVSLLCLIWGL